MTTSMHVVLIKPAVSGKVLAHADISASDHGSDAAGGGTELGRILKLRMVCCSDHGWLLARAVIRAFRAVRHRNVREDVESDRP
jgi:hypothetical protein